MKITDVKVFPVREEKLKAFVSIVFDECFMVNDIKVIRGKEGFFISMPSRRKRNGKFKDIAHPLNNETRKFMEDEILQAYEDTMSDGAEQGQAASTPPARNRPRPEPKTSSSETVDAVRPVAPAAVGQPQRPAEPQRPMQVSERKRAPQVPAEEPAASDAVGADKEDKTLEEVTELHLRDSFWET